MKIKIHIIKQNSLNFPGFPGLSEPCYHQLLGRRKLLIPQGSIFSKAFPPMDSVLNDILIYTFKLIFVWYFRLWWSNDFIGGLSYDQCLSFPNDSILKLHQATLSWIFLSTAWLSVDPGPLLEGQIYSLDNNHCTFCHIQPNGNFGTL